MHLPTRPRHASASVLGSIVCALVGVLLLAGCSGGDPGAVSSGDSASTGSAHARAPRPAPPPEEGACHRLDLASATRPTDDSPAVPCRRPHTSVTIGVGTVDQLHDGHLLAIDSREVQHQLASRCPARMADYLGGSTTTLRLSRFQAVWFGPTVAQADLGAHWSRCDVVAVATEHELARLPANLKGILGRDGVLDRFGTCGTAAPDSPGFHRVICARKHSWRAIGVVNLPARTTYLDKGAGEAAGQHCKDLAAARAGSALKYTWSFEWPSRQRWQAGQRYGYCWVPVG